MVVAALKTLTWGTIATAVGSALLLAYAGTTMPRMTGIPDDLAPAAEAQRSVAPARDQPTQ